MLAFIRLLAVSSAIEFNGTVPSSSYNNASITVIAHTVVNKQTFTGSLAVDIAKDVSFSFNGGSGLTSAVFNLDAGASLNFQDFCFKDSGQFETLHITTKRHCSISIGEFILENSNVGDIVIDGDGTLSIGLNALRNMVNIFDRHMYVYGFKTTVEKDAFYNSWLDTLIFDPLPIHQDNDAFRSLNTNRNNIGTKYCPLILPNFENCTTYTFAPTPAPTPSESSNTGLIVGGVVAAVLLVGAVILVVKNRSSPSFFKLI